MADVKGTLEKLTNLDGYVGSCIVDSSSGMMMAADGSSDIVNLELAAAGNTEVVRAKRQTMRSLNLDDSIEDILITLHKQYHLIRPLTLNDAVFVYLVLDRERGNLAMARMRLSAAEQELDLNS